MSDFEDKELAEGRDITVAIEKADGGSTMYRGTLIKVPGAVGYYWAVRDPDDWICPLHTLEKWRLE